MTAWLIDKSALVRLGESPDAGEWASRIQRGLAVEVLALLADHYGRHRAPSIPDLIIAATAELAGLTVLHLDKGFELIAEITGQPAERLSVG